MIVVSLLLVLGSAALLVLGLASGTPSLVWFSIGTAAVAAVIVGASAVRRRGEAARPGSVQPHGASATDIGPIPPGGLTDADPVAIGWGPEVSAVPPPAAPPEPPAVPSDTPAAPPDPPDEPGVEDVSASDAPRVLDLHDEVYVVDQRPRYHLAGCDRLTGVDTIPLELATAAGLGFTPCARCRPVAALVAGRITDPPPA